jgi:hypothetical protein
MRRTPDIPITTLYLSARVLTISTARKSENVTLATGVEAPNEALWPEALRLLMASNAT